MDPSSLNKWSSRLLLEEAATLAFMREGPGDIRPALPLLFHAQDCGQFPLVHLYGVGYLGEWCRLKGRRVGRDVIEYAAGDALAVLWCRRAPQPVAVRSRAFGIRNATYFELRTLAVELYETRLHEARVRFASGTIYSQDSSYSCVGAWKVAPSAAPRDAHRSLAWAA